MSLSYKDQLVFTVKSRCRVCYSCIRECPVKAIRIENGQAEVMNKRCIGCGNCTRVCSQGAKTYLRTIDSAFNILENATEKKVALIAPSFPAEFHDLNDYKIFVGMVRALGFDAVLEVSFGADLVARAYDKFLYSNEDEHGYISSDCPSITFFIRHYYPHLSRYLVPVVSPMIASTRVARKKYGAETKVIFAGPCVAKKAESPEVDEVVTFSELREMFENKGITPENTQPAEFDTPIGGKGSVFPISHGLLQTTTHSSDIAYGKMIVADGHINVKSAVEEYDKGLIQNYNLELLSCEGCIMGPGTSPDGIQFARRSYVSDYVKQKMANIDMTQWVSEMEKYGDIDLSICFTPEDRRNPLPTKEKIDKVLLDMGKQSEKDYLNCGACGYRNCVEHATAVAEGSAEIETCLPYLIDKLHQLVSDLNISNEKLANAQEALKQQEKLAHMGQLSAGIAHELNNPLGVITMYSNILKEECLPDNPIRADLDLIAEQADRCKNIVKGLLNFARKNQVNHTLVNLEEFVHRSIASIIKTEAHEIVFEPKMKNKEVEIDQDQMMQVLTNIEKNAIEAMPDGGKITLTTEDTEHEVKITIADTGQGIAPENMEKLFTPFFTTKGVGKGTGLGLALIYGIVKMHKGQINVFSNNDPKKGQTGTKFVITLPRYKS